MPQVSQAAEIQVASAAYLEEVGQSITQEYAGVYEALAARRV